MKKWIFTLTSATVILLGAYTGIQAHTKNVAELPSVYSTSNEVASELPSVYKLSRELPSVY